MSRKLHIHFPYPSRHLQLKTLTLFLLGPCRQSPEDIAQNLKMIKGEISFLFHYGIFSEEKEFYTAVGQYLQNDSRFDSDKLLFMSPHDSSTSRFVPQRTSEPLTVEKKDFGYVDIIYSNTLFGFYRLRISPGRSIPTHHHKIMFEAELPLHSGLLLQNRPVIPGRAREWPQFFPHRYDNPTEKELSVLCIDQPQFIEEDEVICQEERLLDVDPIRQKAFF